MILEKRIRCLPFFLSHSVLDQIPLSPLWMAKQTWKNGSLHPKYPNWKTSLNFFFFFLCWFHKCIKKVLKKFTYRFHYCVVFFFFYTFPFEINFTIIKHQNFFNKSILIGAIFLLNKWCFRHELLLLVRYIVQYMNRKATFFQKFLVRSKTKHTHGYPYIYRGRNVEMQREKKRCVCKCFPQ